MPNETYQEQVEYLRANREEIKGKYGSDYIALQGTKILDSCPDMIVLSERIKEKGILITTIDAFFNDSEEELTAHGIRDEGELRRLNEIRDRRPKIST